MLRMREVSKDYTMRGRGVQALDRATLDIPEGDFVSIVGPSGSGKSTLLLILGGMLTPSRGEVLLQGQSFYDRSPDERARLRKEKIGFVFQTFNLVPYLSALENVQIPLMLSGMREDLQCERARSLLERMGLGDRLDHKPSELSVGQQQRVALARTLANDPQLVLADEPTGNLDPHTSGEVMAFLEEIHGEGRTVVMVTHDPAAARRARRTLHLEAGCIHAAQHRDLEQPVR